MQIKDLKQLMRADALTKAYIFENKPLDGDGWNVGFATKKGNDLSPYIGITLFRKDQAGNPVIRSFKTVDAALSAIREVGFRTAEIQCETLKK